MQIRENKAQYFFITSGGSMQMLAELTKNACESGGGRKVEAEKL